MTDPNYRNELERRADGPSKVTEPLDLDALAAKHRPFTIYEECDCADDAKQHDDGKHEYVNDVGLTCNVLCVVCRSCCCGGSEYQSEDCATWHKHTMDPSDRCDVPALIERVRTAEADRDAYRARIDAVRALCDNANRVYAAQVEKTLQDPELANWTAEDEALGAARLAHKVRAALDGDDA